MVVGLHARLLEDFSPKLGYVLVNGIFRVAVPLFLLINGYYLYAALRGGNLRKWLTRVLSLYAFWMLVYAPFWALPLDVSPFGIAQTAQKMIFGYHHLWYIVGMAGGGIVLYATRGAPLYAQALISLALFLVGVGVQYAGALDVYAGTIDRILDANWSHRNALLFAYPFMFLGMAIRACDVDRNIGGRQVIVAVAAGLVLLIAESLRNFEQGVGLLGFDNLASLMLFCPAAFIATLKLGGNWDSRILAKLSSGIFFVHPLFLMVLSAHESHAAFLGAVLFSASASVLLIKLSKKLSFVL